LSKKNPKATTVAKKAILKVRAAAKGARNPTATSRLLRARKK
jgi:hypothetical protein